MPRTNLIDKNNKFIISVNYKCASSQIIRWFRSNINDYKHENTTLSNVINRAYVFGDTHLNKFNDYYKILIVRNPFARLVSSYIDKGFHNFVPLINLCKKYGITVSDLTFRQFVNMVSNTHIKLMNAHWRPLYFDNQPQLYNKVIKMEHIYKHINRIGKKYGYSEFPKNSSKKMIKKKDLTNVPISQLKNMPQNIVKNYANYYTPEIVSIVNDIYSKDLKMFKYSFDRFINS